MPNLRKKAAQTLRENERPVKLPSCLMGLSGKVGNMVYRLVNGKTVVSRRRPEPRNPTPEQRARAAKFGRVSTDAERLLADPTQRAYYEQLAQERGTTA